MRKKDFKRINLWVDPVLYNQIKKNAAESYLRIATYTRQLIQQAMKNNIIKNLVTNQCLEFGVPKVNNNRVNQLLL